LKMTKKTKEHGSGQKKNIARQKIKKILKSD
jgi:hypothetical protein